MRRPLLSTITIIISFLFMVILAKIYLENRTNQLARPIPSSESPDQSIIDAYINGKDYEPDPLFDQQFMSYKKSLEELCQKPTNTINGTSLYKCKIFAASTENDGYDSLSYNFFKDENSNYGFEIPTNHLPDYCNKSITTLTSLETANCLQDEIPSVDELSR